VAGAPTPAIAALTRANVAHTLHPYHHDPDTTAFGDEVVQALGWPADRVFKTLVASVDGRLTIGIVPVTAQLDLKALAAACQSKKAQMADVKQAERTTGYVAGGISPLGQRKALPTVIDESATQHATIHVSGGRRGLEVELTPGNLQRLTRATFADIART